ncbi:galactose-1-phosphate uridylyltransferase [Botrimarina hoheduenensis]|uniref:Galactose-1-phosphate uridylyltransferase n=1 Tax=Botrimarina hoheduenensis TaxID=2528000 RepID=A0A5C5W847_9BACT|nr:hypothetical protein [Botrimarina hoheduenensis]TWT46433.1 galactose-1-phosphate uridylyltransferase [Botrimarina hoheduenensis]
MLRARCFLTDPTISHWVESQATGRRVRIAPRRDARPSDFSPHAERRCPFCCGAEGDTPPEIERIADDKGGWLGRVVPNRYAAFEAPDGAQEVVIESPRHTKRFVDLAPNEAAAAVSLWARRLTYWRAQSSTGYELVFKNEGAAAGASLEHTHSQVVALPATPPGYSPAGSTKLARDAQEEESLRILAENGLEAFAAPTPRFAYETSVVAEEARQDFSHYVQSETASHLAELLRQVLLGIRTASGFDAFNLMIDAPRGGLPWRIDITPRHAVMAGFELATGMWINATPPEFAAKRLREALENDRLSNGQGGR